MKYFTTVNPYAQTGASVRCDDCGKSVDVAKGDYHCAECKCDYCPDCAPKYTKKAEDKPPAAEPAEEEKEEAKEGDEEAKKEAAAAALKAKEEAEAAEEVAAIAALPPADLLAIPAEKAPESE